MVRASALVTSFVFAGCASITSLQPAETLGEGRAQVAVESSYQGVVAPGVFRGYPTFGVAYRYGATSHLDLMGKLGPSGIELGGKAQLYQSQGGKIVSVAPSVGVSGFTEDTVWLRVWNVAVPVLIGIPAGDGEWVLGPRLHFTGVHGSAGSTRGALWSVLGGASVGYAIPGEHGWVVPELSAVGPIAVWARRSDGIGGTSWLRGEWTLQAGLGLLWGGGRAKR